MEVLAVFDAGTVVEILPEYVDFQPLHAAGLAYPISVGFVARKTPLVDAVGNADSDYLESNIHCSYYEFAIAQLQQPLRYTCEFGWMFDESTQERKGIDSRLLVKYLYSLF